MKDSYARAISKRLNEKLGDLFVGQCPKCEHETIMIDQWQYPMSRIDSHAICSTCGTKVKCVTKLVCEKCQNDNTR